MRQKIGLEMATRLINNGPLVMIVSMYEDRVDVTPIAWHMPISKNPPLIAFEISQTHFIYQCIMRTKDFTVNIPSSDMMPQVISCGTESGAAVDKLRMTGLTTELSRTVKSPTLQAAMGVLECVLVEDRYLLETYSIVLGEVKHAEVEPDAFDEHWLFSSRNFRTIHHLGDMTFSSPDNEILHMR
jgi:flavin reductase (DIM6/NTAB) family NADH-FMN oxidoreductase RutF